MQRSSFWRHFGVAITLLSAFILFHTWLQYQRVSVVFYQGVIKMQAMEKLSAQWQSLPPHEKKKYAFYLEWQKRQSTASAPWELPRLGGNHRTPAHFQARQGILDTEK